MARLAIDLQTANLEVRYWLDEVANVRHHATIDTKPLEKFKSEVTLLLPLPAIPYFESKITVPKTIDLSHAFPMEYLQHNLHVYDQLFLGAAQ